MKLLADREFREKYGRDGRKVIEMYFSMDSVTKKLAKIYTDMLTNKLEK